MECYLPVSVTVAWLLVVKRPKWKVITFGVKLLMPYDPMMNLRGHRSSISYRPIQPFDLEVLVKIHGDLFPIRYEIEFFHNVVNGCDIVSWGAVDRNRPNGQSDEIIGFVTARIVMAKESEVENSFDGDKDDGDENAGNEKDGGKMMDKNEGGNINEGGSGNEGGFGDKDSRNMNAKNQTKIESAI